MKRKSDYLRIFGLREPFTEEELGTSYRALAKLSHPDVSDDPAAEMRMMILNEGYEFLKEYISEHPCFENASCADESYLLYREAVDLIGEGFDGYYGGSIAIENLKQFLSDAKEKLSIMIKHYETSDWYSDSIDRICSINKWLD